MKPFVRKWAEDISLLLGVILISQRLSFREGVKKNRLFLGKSPKLWVGGGQES